MSDSAGNLLTIAIADWAVTLLLDRCDEATRVRIADRYAAFIVPTLSASMSVDVRTEPGPHFIPFRGTRLWQVNTALRDGVIEFESHSEKGWIDRRAGHGEVVLRPHGDIENYLRVLYAWLCIDHSSLLLHSCGIIRGEWGYVFFGPSGSGKTTTATLSSAFTILSDDLVIIRKVKDTYRVYGVPFRGNLPEAPRTNASAELRGLFSLVKDNRHFLTPLALPEAVASLARCVPFVMAQPENAVRVTEICDDLARHVPVRMLHFQRDSSFWEMIN